MENTINHRVYVLIEYFKMNANSFAKAIGKESQTVRQIISGRNKPGYDFLMAILKSFDGINVEWLMTGEGEMLKQNNFYEKATHEENNTTFVQSKSGLVETIEDKKIIIDFLNGDVSRLKKENELLKQEIENLKKGKHKTMVMSEITVD